MAITQAPLTKFQRFSVAFCVFLALLFDGVELGLMPIASLSVTRDLLKSNYSPQIGADWFAWLTASLMMGAAIGGIAFGRMGDKAGRVRALAASVLFYSLFAGLGGLATSLNQLLFLRFLVGLGVGGVWPNGIALAAECWTGLSKPSLSGFLGSAINVGILGLSQVARLHPITPDSWRWLFQCCAAPGLLGLFILRFLPESPQWIQIQSNATTSHLPTPPAKYNSARNRPTLLLAIFLGTIPLLGAWAASKWMIPWADQIAGPSNPTYKAAAQGWWALGASLGGFLGALIAGRLGPKLSFALVGALSTIATCSLFLLTRPLSPFFLPLVFTQGLIATLFFGWLPLYLPAMFPTEIRATSTGIAYNTGRFLTALGVLASSLLVRWFDGDYSAIGAAAGCIYAIAIPAAFFIPDPLVTRSAHISNHPESPKS